MMPARLFRSVYDSGGSLFIREVAAVVGAVYAAIPRLSLGKSRAEHSNRLFQIP